MDMDSSSSRRLKPAIAATGALPAALPVHDIRPPTRWSAARFRDLWPYRELLFFLALRDVKVRYKQAFIGVGWAVVQPVSMMVVFWVFLSKLAHVNSGRDCRTACLPSPA